MCNSNNNLIDSAYKEYYQQLKKTCFPLFEDTISLLSLDLQKYEYSTNSSCPEGRFVKGFTTRFFHENFGVIACLRGGVLYAAQHHIRSLLETVAIFNYVYSECHLTSAF